MKWLTLLAALAGCLPVAKTSTTVLDRRTSEVIAVPTGQVALETRVTDGVIAVRALQSRRCHRDVSDVVQVTSKRTPKQVGTADGEIWGWLLVSVWPVELATVAYSMVATAGGPDVATRIDKVATLYEACAPIAIANVKVQLQLPSSATVDGVTDDTGSFLYVPAAGELAVAGAVTTRVVHVPVEEELPPAPTASARNGFSAVRDAVRQCGPRYGVTGVVKVTVAIDKAGAVSSAVPDRGGEELATCPLAVLANARFSDERDRTISVRFMIR